MQQLHLQSSGRVINMRQYNVQITDEALSDMEQLEIRRMLVDNYSVFFVIQDDKVVVTDVLYSASDIERRLKG